jgi:uncharacterized membrane protein YidH (DUF202 family)
MARSSNPASVGETARPGDWGRGDAALFALAPTALVLIAVQFALAGFGAFTMDLTPTTSAQHAYGAHAVLGLVIAALTLLILGAALASRSARTHRRTLWLTVTMAVLSAAAQPLLGEAGTHVPVIGALHALSGLIIFAATCWLTWETARRRAASQPTWTTPPGPPARDPGARTDLR